MTCSIVVVRCGTARLPFAWIDHPGKDKELFIDEWKFERDHTFGSYSSFVL